MHDVAGIDPAVTIYGRREGWGGGGGLPRPMQCIIKLPQNGALLCVNSGSKYRCNIIYHYMNQCNGVN